MNRSDQAITAMQPGQPNSISATGCTIAPMIRAIGPLEFPAGQSSAKGGGRPAGGLIPHAHEQMTGEKPMKLAACEDITYTGPARRNVPRKIT
ncbi:MAG: hypothetical protein HYV75_06800 [Opitutae bacterium]|nr:hypothetical protein [Opitutae bacterium]